MTNDSDVDGNPLTITAATSPNGTVVINPNGTITFTPDPNFNGPTVITLHGQRRSGRHRHHRTIAVNSHTGQRPARRAQRCLHDGRGYDRAHPVLANDSDADNDPLTVTAASSPNGTVVINVDGTVSFTPAPNFFGPATITYTISDGRGGTSTATVTVNVVNTNESAGRWR